MQLVGDLWNLLRSSLGNSAFRTFGRPSNSSYVRSLGTLRRGWQGVNGLVAWDLRQAPCSSSPTSLRPWDVRLSRPRACSVLSNTYIHTVDPANELPREIAIRYQTVLAVGILWRLIEITCSTLERLRQVPEARSRLRWSPVTPRLRALFARQQNTPSLARETGQPLLLGVGVPYRLVAASEIHSPENAGSLKIEHYQSSLSFNTRSH